MSKRPTILFFALGCIALTAGLLVGISDNPPGLILVYLASASFILAITQRWRTVRSYVILLIASIVGFLVAAVLHNLLYGLGEVAGDLALLKAAAEVLHVAFFLIAIFLCPVGVIIGAVGSLLTWRRRRKALP